MLFSKDLESLDGDVPCPNWKKTKYGCAFPPLIPAPNLSPSPLTVYLQEV